MNFRGRSLRNLDPKGRLMLSPEYRESLALRMLTTNNNSFFNNNTTILTPQTIHSTSPHNVQTPDAIATHNTINTCPSSSQTNSESHQAINIITTENNSENIQTQTIYQPNTSHFTTLNQEAISTQTNDSPTSPAKTQELKLVITTYDNCLAAFPWNDWLILEEQFSRLTNPSSKVRAFRRLFIGGAEEQTVDGQGRIRLSADHREYAQLEKEVTILGLITRFELWNPHVLKSHTAAQSLDDVTEELSSSGIEFAL